MKKWQLRKRKVVTRIIPFNTEVRTDPTFISLFSVLTRAVIEISKKDGFDKREFKQIFKDFNNQTGVHHDVFNFKKVFA